MPPTYTLHEIGRIPAPGDNVAIATRRIPAGTAIAIGGARCATDATILEGHRFAIAPIAAGQALLSWELPFGYATRDIAPGAYVRNAKILAALRVRALDFALPDEANFRDTALAPYALDEARFRPGAQAPLYPPDERRTFLGYAREGGRGAGTRNYVVVLATTSRTASWARALEERLAGLATGYPDVDGVVAVAHTEGGAGEPNNRELLLRTLAGFAVHPNVGAALAVDQGDEAVTNHHLRAYLREHGYPLDHVLHRFVTLRDTFDADLARGAALVREWLPRVGALRRTPALLADLKLGLQCGGSDAFSGISGNPLAAWVAKELIRHGGSANLAETDELIGAEEYVLQNVRDLATARRFLAMVERFKERVGWHGHTAEGNPSGGNNFRGLYNIALKSLGAAMKRHPDVRLDYAIEYGERMAAPGYYFMDSPGNDLESIAGQVASGSNFPFVPTIKIVTTTARHRLLAGDLDVNAGAYLDGTPMDDLGRDLLERTIAAASGERTAGERAGHAQVSIWRDWRQTGPVDVARLRAAPAPSGEPLPLRPAPADDPLAGRTFAALDTADGPVTDRAGLILPTSLCAGQIARRIAADLNARGAGPLSRYVALPHTEGCGVSSGASEELYTRTLVGYLLHPLVGRALLLEHGCEKTHNDYLRQELLRRDVDPARFGWASIQLDGGIAAVGAKVADWFATSLAGEGAPMSRPAGLGDLRLGLAAVGPAPAPLAAAFARLTRLVAGAGGTVVVPENAPFLADPAYRAPLLGDAAHAPTLAYGEAAARAGLHVMAAPTAHWVETLTGLGATGVELVVVHAARPVQAHRLVPVLQVATAPAEARQRADFDLLLDGAPAAWPAAVLDLVLRAAGRAYTPTLFARGNVDFQFTRGLLGVSM